MTLQTLPAPVSSKSIISSWRRVKTSCLFRYSSLVSLDSSWKERKKMPFFFFLFFFFFFLSFLFLSFLPPLNYVSGLLNKKEGGEKGANKSCLSLALHGGFAHQGRLAFAITTGKNSIFGRRRAHRGREIMTLLANQIRACCSVGLNEEWHRLAAV